MLRAKLRIEPETDLGLYLGCFLSKGESHMYDGCKVKTLTYNMEGLLLHLSVLGNHWKRHQVEESINAKFT